MNFKFTKTKTIVILLISVISGFILAIKTTGFDMPLIISSSLPSSWLFWFIVLFVISYVLYSLIENKK